jgi:formylglycine-generating enzyme required for sulfatase activity
MSNDPKFSIESKEAKGSVQAERIDRAEQIYGEKSDIRSDQDVAVAKGDGQAAVIKTIGGIHIYGVSFFAIALTFVLTLALTLAFIFKYTEINPAIKPENPLELVLILVTAAVIAAAAVLLVGKVCEKLVKAAGIRMLVVLILAVPFFSISVSLAFAWKSLPDTPDRPRPPFGEFVRDLFGERRESPVQKSPYIPKKKELPAEPVIVPDESSLKTEVPEGEIANQRKDMPESETARKQTPETAAEVKPASVNSRISKPTEKPNFINDLGMKFVYIPPGDFMMGSPENEKGRYDRETLHKVTLTKGFYMQTTEVTQGQWKAVMGNNPSYFKNCGDDCPVEDVSWNDIQDFIAKINRRGEGTYRLPTEAEWEYACRADSQTAYCFGDDENLLPEYAWYDRNSEDRTHPVGQKKPNAWGLYDMHGNVWEWCQDIYSTDIYEGEQTYPIYIGKGSDRVLRGGSWINGARDCRSARLYFSPDFRSPNLGFRLSREAP